MKRKKQEREATTDEIAELDRHIEAKEAQKLGGRVFVDGESVIVRLNRDVDAVNAARIAANMVVSSPGGAARPTARRDVETGGIVLALNLEEAMIDL
jgi:hypothetical protein